jgi:hypothetical protein
MRIFLKSEKIELRVKLFRSIATVDIHIFYNVRLYPACVYSEINVVHSPTSLLVHM